MTSPRHFDANYHETFVLPDGLEVTLRPVRPSDKGALVEGLGRMSPQSRYLRFFTSKSQFTSAELRYLTEVDGENHVALIAYAQQSDGSIQGAGIARFVRLKGEPTVAEAAVAVVDEFQRRGLGRLLFLRIAAAARERGIERIRSEVLSQNVAVRTIIHKLAPGAREQRDGNVILVDAPLHDVAPTIRPEDASPGGPNYRLLALAAVEALEVRHPSLRPTPAAPSADATKDPAARG
jgi:GNAT superfamily N-acetyltransferase